MRCATCPMTLICHTGEIQDRGWFCSSCGRTVWHTEDSILAWFCEGGKGQSVKACSVCEPRIRFWTHMRFEDLDEAAQDEAANQKGVFDL